MADTDYETLFQEDGDGQTAAIIEALRRRQEATGDSEAALRSMAGRQQRQAQGLRALSLLASVGQNPLLAGLRQEAGAQGRDIDSLAARTEQRLAGRQGDPLAPLRLLQAQTRLKQAAEQMKAQAGRFEASQAQSAEQRALDRASRERAAAITAGDKATQDQLNNEAKIRSEIAGNKVVQEEQAAAVALSKVQRAAADASPAGDLALIFGYMKTLDPASAVREGEFANAQNAAGVPDRIRNAYNKVISGERLNPQQRQEFVRNATSQYGAVKQRADAIREGYRGVAAKSGIQTDRVIVPGVTTPDISLDKPPVAPSGKVRIRLPDGSEKLIPADKVEEAKRDFKATVL